MSRSSRREKREAARQRKLEVGERNNPHDEGAHSSVTPGLSGGTAAPAGAPSPVSPASAAPIAAVAAAPISAATAPTVPGAAPIAAVTAPVIGAGPTSGSTRNTGGARAETSAPVPRTSGPAARVSAARNTPAEAAPAPGPPPARPRTSATTACYVDFENVFFSTNQHGRKASVPRMVRLLNRLSRQVAGQGWAHTAVYANWDGIVTQARHAQDDWAMLGWRTVNVPTREDYLSQRTVKNMVDFVMSLDMLEDARDRGYDHFFIVSGDQDFCEVVERLKRLGRKVTVLALKPNLSFRLREAADDYIVWSFDDVTGDESMVVDSYKRLAQAAVVPGRAQQEEPYQVLLRAVRLAERDQGAGPVPWAVIRDEYFLKMVRMSSDEADRFVRELDKAGFVTMRKRKHRDGALHAYLSVPR
jgi:uncharacterized LabA/DUF88 family protein